jgi:hypothetical protein
MVKKLIFLPLLFSILSCQFSKEKIANYYLNKAEAISKSEEVSTDEIDKFYLYLSKALDYDKNLYRAVELSDKMAQESMKAGYFKASELNMELIKKYLRLNPYSFNIYLNLISVYSIKGDIINIEDLSNQLNSLYVKSEDKLNKIRIKMLIQTSYCNILPWLESKGYLSMNTNPDETINNLSKYVNYANKIFNLKKEIEEEKELAEKVEKEIYYAYEIAEKEALKNMDEIKRNISLEEMLSKDQNYSKALDFFLNGNIQLAKKQYPNARIYYKSALSNFPDLINAKKQILETDFQESMSKAITRKDLSGIALPLYGYNQKIKEIAEEAEEKKSQIPFISDDKFLSEIYALKAAILTSILTVDNKLPQKRKLKMKEEIEDALDKSIKLYPQNKMAKDIFERFRENETKEK